MKATINISIGFLMWGILGGMELGSIGIKNGLVSLVICTLALFLINKKKSAASRKCNGQAHNMPKNKIDCNYYTPKKGGVSSGL